MGFDAVRPVEIIRKPVDPYGSVIKDDPQVEVFEFGGRRLKPSGKAAQITIEIAPHTDGLWMWSASGLIRTAYSGYRIGPKWGKFAKSRRDAITAACNELVERDPPPEVNNWLERLCGPLQMELFE